MQTRRSQEPVPRKGCEGANPSRRTEGEPARRPGSPAKRCAVNLVACKSPAFLAWKMKPLGGGLVPAWKAGGGRKALRFKFSLPPMESEPGRRTGAASKADEGLTAQGIMSSALRSRMVNLPGGGRRFETGRGVRAPGDRPLRLPLAATQPVKRLA